jgi:cation diffusion facilitator CzcD-associated flavoprotein CzcO
MNDSTPETPATQDEIFDLLVIGAGPTGLACAIEAQKAGFRSVVVDKGCLCNSLFHYPAHMTFFTTSELLEIGGIPFPSPNAKPTRTEALEYYRQVTAYYKLDAPVSTRHAGNGRRWGLYGAYRGSLRPPRSHPEPQTGGLRRLL